MDVLKRSFLSYCVLVIVVPAAGSATVQDSITPEVIDLRFDWPAHLHAQVEAVRYQIRTADGKTDSTYATVGYTMISEPHAEGILMRSLDFAVTGESSTRGAPSMQEIAEQMQGITPGLIVSTSGELVRLDDIEGLQSKLRAMVGPLLDSLPDSLPPQARAQFAQLMQTLTSQEYLLAKTSEDWNAIVGTWLDASFELGAVYEMEGEEPSPALPDMLIPFIYEFSAVERVACVDGESDSSCVLLEMVANADREVLGQLMEDFVGEILSGMGAPAMYYEELNLETTIQLVTEPATLVPHYVHMRQHMYGTVVVTGEGSSRMSELRGREYRYSYPSRQR